MLVCEVRTRPDGSEYLVPLKPVSPAGKGLPKLTARQRRALRNMLLMKLITTEEEDE